MENEKFSELVAYSPVKKLLNPKSQTMALNRHNQEPAMNVVGNFIKVNATHPLTALVDIPPDICQKLPKTFLPQVLINV
jgi:hypothetical protein